MRFKARLQAPYHGGILDGNDTLLEFTKSQIIFPKKNAVRFENREIVNEVYYKLEIKDSVRRSERYQIKINGISYTIRLGMNKWNEIKLKWIHKLYSFQKDATAATVIAIISLIATIVLGLLQLRGK